MFAAISAAITKFGRGTARLQEALQKIEPYKVQRKARGLARVARTGTVARDRRRAQKARNRKRNRRAHK